MGFAQGIPVVGDQLTSALRLVPLAIEGTQVAILGRQAASLLTAVAANPLDSSARGMSTSDLTTLQADLGAIRALFNQLVGQLDGLQPRDLALDPRLGPQVRDLRAYVPQVAQALADLQAVAAVAGPLLGVGAPSHYLLEILDSTELRPGGGFIGSYGFLTLSGGHLAQTDPLSIKDVDLLDKHFQHGNQFILLPPQYHWFDLVNRWSFGDSNLDADFPTDARNAEQLYTVEGGLVPTQEIRGVIAITPWLIQNMLHIVGPVSIPELKTIVTADNLVQQIHYHQLTAGVAAGPDTVIDPTTGTSLRKRFTGLLFQHFLAQLKQAQSQHLGALVHLLLDSVRTKDIQIYLNNPTAEQVLQDYHAASTIDAPAQSDSLLVVDANMAGSKANYFIPQAMDDAVTVEASGTATHHLRLTYTFPTGPNVLHDTYAAHDPHIYVSYVRVYVPPTAKLQSIANWTIDERGSAFGRQVWGGRMFLRYGTHLTLSLVWTVPAAAVAQASGGWIYAAEIQHQAGSIWRITEHVQLPACGHLTSVTPPLTAQSPGAAGMTGTFSEDMHTTVLYDSSRC